MSFFLKIYYLTLIFFSFTLMKPSVVCNPDIDSKRLQSYYKWVTPELFQIIYYYSNLHGVSVDDVCALIQSESNGKTWAISYANARGLMQVMPFHYNGPADDLNTNIHLNIHLGTRNWAWCMKFAKGDKRRAIIAYNAGPGLSVAKYRNWDYLNTICRNSSNTVEIDNTISYFIY